MMLRLCLAAALVLTLVDVGLAQTPSGYAEVDENACLDCHATPGVMEIVETAHFDASEERTPAGQKQCQSCHGPSATHIRFPMQVENLRFGEKSAARPEVQNAACLECHADGGREHWKASAHGYEDVLCSECHDVHGPGQITPVDGDLLARCTDACHGELMTAAASDDFTHAVGKPLDPTGTLTCATCHNPHGTLESSRCDTCHTQDADVLAKQSPKAQRFHETATERGTECMRCHKGIAHPVKDPMGALTP